MSQSQIDELLVEIAKLKAENARLVGAARIRGMQGVADELQTYLDQAEFQEKRAEAWKAAAEEMDDAMHWCNDTTCTDVLCLEQRQAKASLEAARALNEFECECGYSRCKGCDPTDEFPNT